MRKTVLLMIALGMIYVQTLSSQWTVGGKVSVISNQVVAESGATNLNGIIKPTTGYDLGVFANYNLTDTWSLQSELNYKRTGLRLSEGTSFEVGFFNIPLGATVDVSTSYLEVPLLLGYQHDFGGVQAYLRGGPSLSYALEGSVTSTANTIIDVTINESDLNFSSDTYQRWVMGGAAAAGLSYPISGDLVLSGEVRYTGDFGSSVEVPIVDVGVRNRGWRIGMGLAKKF